MYALAVTAVALLKGAMPCQDFDDAALVAQILARGATATIANFVDPQSSIGIALDGMLQDSVEKRWSAADVVRWIKRSALHGFVDFNHVFRPFAWGVGKTHPGVAIARCILEVQAETSASLKLSWDDHLVLSVNGERTDLGTHHAFRTQTIQALLKAGVNPVVLKLSNTLGSNPGGWAFAFQAVTAAGDKLEPAADV